MERESRCQVFLFFFQAEDGIRDLTVTGVQTCALPIYLFHPFLPVRQAPVCFRPPIRDRQANSAAVAARRICGAQPLNGDFQYGLIAAPMTASMEPPAPIGQLVNTSQPAIYGINRDFRDRSVLRSSRAAEWTT